MLIMGSFESKVRTNLFFEHSEIKKKKFTKKVYL